MVSSNPPATKCQQPRRLPLDKQILIQDLMRVAQICGTTSLTRRKYVENGGAFTYSLVSRRFGSWNTALRAAGLDVSHTQIIGDPRGNLVIPIGDIHFPFESTFVIDAILNHIELRQPSHVVQMGDLYDLYSYSRFPRSHNIYTPQQELDIAEDKARRFWAEVRKRAPDAKCFQLWGNHDDRAIKRIFERSPEHAQFVEEGMRKLMTFDGVTTMLDSREELEIDGVLYIHGYLIGLGSHARANQRRIVCAHSHLGGVAMVKTEAEILWELNVGWCGNRFAAAMGYAAQRRLTRMTTGVGEVDKFGPRFIPINAEAKA